MSPETAPRGFFRCPHCRQKTITAWTKLRTRGACPGCGGRFVASSWGFIPALLVTPFAVLAPLVLLFQFHPFGFPLFWLTLAAGTVLAAALSAIIFLFTTLLYRKGSVASRWDAIGFFTVIAALIVAGMMNADFEREAGLASSDFMLFPFGASSARDDDMRITSTVNYSDAERQQAFKDALGKAGIRYKLETREGKEFVGWTRAQDPAVRKIQEQVNGSELPPRRSVSFDNPALEKEFADWLAGKGLKHEKKNSSGREYIVWEGPDDLVHQFMRERPSVPCDKKVSASGAGTRKCG
jgi:hypothetical protein